MVKKSFSFEIYEKISINNLILVCLYKLESTQKTIDFEDLLKHCFKLFPKKLNFIKNFKWPDARKLDRPLRDLRRKKLVSNKTDQGFALTKTGHKKACEIMNLLRQKKLKLN
ncbi:MAG: hypothetical protein ISS87_01890 [Candidatus Pacebacteria bacterium]|nr:hypothetical protein [Candidatus Paceibacterota bacterium]